MRAMGAHEDKWRGPQMTGHFIDGETLKNPGDKVAKATLGNGVYYPRSASKHC